MTPVEITVGWVGCFLFIWSGWLLGSKGQADRRDGIFGFIIVNMCFAVQAGSMGNWSLFTLSVIGMLLQLRAWTNWKIYDEPNDVRDNQTRRS